MKKSFYLFFLFCLIIFSCKNNQNYSFENNIIPKPTILIEGESGLKVLNDINVVMFVTNEDSKKIRKFVGDFLSKSFSVSFSTAAKKNHTNLFLSIDGTGEQESYTLVIDNSGIQIISPSYVGLFWGFQTLRQLFPSEIEAGASLTDVELPHLKIEDEPRFKYRGMHLDVCRHFFSVADVKSYIDLLVMHKFNVFHWHLTEDQGWRIEIKSLPKLTEISSQRSETVIYKNWGEYDGVPYGGYYTQEQIREIVKYAEERFITVIPEIEMPGHALAALAAYPELGCTGGPYSVGTTWGVFDDVFCAGNEQTFEFLEKVIDEVCEMFPNSPYIHIGGDECPKTRWENCPKCQQRIKTEGLADEHELQSYFVQRMGKYINTKDKRIIGWDEILEGGLAPDATVMSWRGEEGGIAAAQLHHDVIMTPNPYCYFDHYQSEDTENEPFAIGGFTNCEKIYKWNPIPLELNDEQRNYIIGVQANVWTEYIKDISHVQYMVLPRMAALSEVAWSKNIDQDYLLFKKRLQSMFERYRNAGYNFAKHELE
jgi:hexosaminidase